MKTHQEKLEFIRAKCIEVNPSIKDLVVGVIARGGSRNELMIYTGFKPDISEYGNGNMLHNFSYIARNGGYVDSRQNFEIIGRDIKLSDILLAIGMYTDECVCVLDDGTFADREDVVLGDWNLLKDNLEDQSEETIDFIYNNLLK
jgi:hypothetical protein